MDQEPEIAARWSAVRKFAGYGAAATMSLYLVVKVTWVAGLLLGQGDPRIRADTTDWILLNALTVAMAAVGIVLGLALAQRWGRRVPGPPLVFFGWLGAGFLVPMLPYLAVSTVIGGGGDEGGSTMPAWEAIFMSIGFAGMAAGTAVGLPIYMRERWPSAFLDQPRTGRPGRLLAAYVAACALGALWLFWTAGGTLGLASGGLDLNARLLNATSAIWAFVAVWGTRRIVAGRGPSWVFLSLAFVGTGSLFAWSAWKLPMAILRPGDYVPLEQPAVAVIQHLLAITAGAVMLAALLPGKDVKAAP
ncbi:hypothetical protein ABGB18_31190 [Nonomuraea sp. B12E4]|uniref:hypothetical protein n=1 Tax=Nonomuraea sp. B12E4 TaxID=3153564 RepID=UPI00325DEFDA